jgi:hypothetical protein
MNESRIFTATSANASVGLFLRDASVVATDKAKSDKTIETAVYNFIQAKRSLGETKVNSVEIANALSLTDSAVQNALHALGDKGVKIKR